MPQLTTLEFEKEYGVTKWYARSVDGKGKVYSAIVNIRKWSDRRRVISVYMYWDCELQDYVTEKRIKL